MKNLIAVLIFFYCLSHTLIAQTASDYLPTLNSSWKVESSSTLDDSVLASGIRTDSLVSIESIDAHTVYTIETSEEGYSYKLDTRDDTLFIRVLQVLASEIFSDSLLVLDVDVDDRLPLAIFSAGVGDEWDVYHLEQTIKLTDSLIAAMPVTVEDEAEIEIKVSGTRLPEEILDLPIGATTTQVFEIRVDLALTVIVRFSIFRIPVTLQLLEGYALRTHVALGHGIVQQFSEQYEVRAVAGDLNVDEYLFTLPANHSRTIEFNEGEPTIVYDENHRFPTHFTLDQNYPNPFNPVTTIGFTITERSNVTLTVYNILGKTVATPVQNELPPGSFRVSFDATHLPSGVYFYTLQANGLKDTRRMVLSK